MGVEAQKGFRDADIDTAFIEKAVRQKHNGNG
jgi:hypothetical protein